MFRRKKGQGALEYLFMIAAALIIIFVVVRYISSSGQQATGQSDIASLQSQAELAKSSLQAKDWWDDDYTITINTNAQTITIDNVSVTIDYSNSKYVDDITTTYNGETLGNIYDDCMEGTEEACKVLAALGGT
ncbi:class III signal peptide-containing protein [Thermococcus sp. EP1]|uniref:class III signal peptide-containing protein n=1 Tax=Thermococcus sp. EP1 TaxID=1591054 RepID=UPI003526CA9C